MPAETSLPCSYSTYEQIKSAKRGGETFHELLTRMADYYEPNAARKEGADE